MKIFELPCVKGKRRRTADAARTACHRRLAFLEWVRICRDLPFTSDCNLESDSREMARRKESAEQAQMSLRLHIRYYVKGAA